MTRRYLMNLPCIAAILLALLIGSGKVRAQEKLTLEEAVKLGIENSKALHASQMKISAAEAKIGEINAARLPQLSFRGGYTRLSSVPPFTFTIPGTSQSMVVSPVVFDNYSLVLSLQQPVFTGFRLESGEKASEYISQATQVDYTKDKSDVSLAVKTAYWNLYKAQEFKRVAEENKSTVEAHLSDIVNMEKNGMATANDVLKVRVQLSNAELAIVDAQNAASLATVVLNNYIGRPLGASVIIATGPNAAAGSLGAPDELLAKAKKQRPELLAADYRIKASQENIITAKSGWYPQVSLGGNYYYNRPNQRIVPTVDAFRDTWDASINVSMSLWNWGATSRQTEQAEAQLAQAVDAQGQIGDAINVEVTQNYLSTTQLKKKIEIADIAVKQAEENLRLTTQRFKNGMALNSDVLDAETMLVSVKNSLAQSVADYEIAVARLGKSLGEL
ncbi:TolC family protein [Ignavibacteria bacterium]|nr:TolC family protein [Bacteroidota bacterium]MCZ2133026.1 TolC family protein [Bacteroidota bacterium]